MGRTLIHVGAVLDATGQINSAKSSVSSAKSAFSQTKNSIDSKIRSRSNIQSRLNTVQNQLSNIGTKIDKISSMVQSGANLYRSTDDKVESWAEAMNDKMGSKGAYISGVYATYFSNDGEVAEVKEKKVNEHIDVHGYSKTAPDSDYAKLCHLLYGALKADDPESAFISKVSGDTDLPEKDPIKKLNPDQLQIVQTKSGFEAAIICDGNTAIVVFAGTEGAGDVVADLSLALGVLSVQEAEALVLVNELSKEYSDIVVTGHSLGGYLATATALRNDAVTKCIAFDPPGRYDTLLQNAFNKDRVDKITTYEVKGSAVSGGLNIISYGQNRNLGEINQVEMSILDDPLHHSIEHIHEKIKKAEDTANARPSVGGR